MNSRQRFSRLLLFTSILFGLVIRLAAPVSADGPVNDGGLFLQMTRDLQENRYVLPLQTIYNHGDIPFAYPPLGFYLAGFLQSLTQISLLQIFAYLPAVLSTLAIPAFYFLSLQITKDRLYASVAALFYAMVPKSFDWAIMGGGITRAPALIFSFLTLAFVYRLFTDKDSRSILPVSVFASLLALTHPEIAFQTSVSLFLLALFYLRGRKSLFHTTTVAALALAFASPWWITVISRHGLAPFQTALGAHPRDFIHSLLYLLQFNLTGEAILDIVAVLGLIGLVSDLHRRDFFLPAWIGLSFISDPRAAPFASLTPLILLAVKGLNSTLEGLNNRAHGTELFSTNFARRVLLGAVAYLFLSGMIFSLQMGNSLRLLPEERQALDWIAQNTPEESRILILTGDAALSDPLSEWFPSLTGRTSLVTVQGHEWTPGLTLVTSIKAYHEAQSCLDKDPGCLSKWEFDYVYFRKIRPQGEGGITGQISLLEGFLRASDDYTIVYDSDVAVIFVRGNPISRAIGPNSNIHIADWSPNRSASKPITSGNTFAIGVVTAPIAMMLAL